MNKKLTLLTGMALAMTLPATAALVVDFTPTTTTYTAPVADQQADGADTWTFREKGDALLGALYSAPDGQNTTFYGGLITTWTPASAYNPLFRNLNTAQLQVRVQVASITDSTLKAAFVWDNTDFLTGPGAVVLGTGSSVSWNIAAYSNNQDGDRQRSMIVSQGGTYYVAQGDGGNTASFDPSAVLWGELNTTTLTIGTYAPLTLDDVLGVGLYVSAHMAGASTASNYATVSFTDFQVTAVPEPGTFALLAGFVTLGLVLFRRRHKAD